MADDMTTSKLAVMTIVYIQTRAVSLPHSYITPGGVEGEAHGLVVPLDRVDGQLLGRGGYAHDVRAVHHPEYSRHRKHQGGGPKIPAVFHKYAFQFAQRFMTSGFDVCTSYEP